MAYNLLRAHYLTLHHTLSRLLSLLFLSLSTPQKLLSTKASFLQSPVFQQTTSELQGSLDSHGKYWWRTSGLLISALLEAAEYSALAQHRILTFFGRTIAPYLGPTYTPGAPQWQSFMTDDHHPIELSWDWHTGHQPPTVRFSIEPVGIHAGTPADPENQKADISFRTAMTAALPDTHMAWPPSKIFYAFDLSANSIKGKAYFFPGFQARATNQTNLEVLSAAIASAPGCSSTCDNPNPLVALHAFQDFARDSLTPPLEMDMLAIDMDPPAESHLKIYSRNRVTSFTSVRQMMTLGGRIPPSEDLARGLQTLRSLWDALLDQSSTPESHLLTPINHRSAGILYNVEFRPYSASLKVKIYIPVRHYASSDEHILTAIRTFMTSQSQDAYLRRDYGTVLRRIVSGFRSPSLPRLLIPQTDTRLVSLSHDDALRDRGLHTYIGCSIQAGGDLRVVSYVNGQGPKLIDGVRV
ncbi:aromatic prenyltransferase [Aspergillus affinis]|uniref:aromatic prenyltransferase n=1 Tax=Aspergillus affinis TaxID=1070780 RepID=UPI0022FEB0B4|nr:aromatic prenyltransferase [Aspergillus affinis]KAI9039002.1 aromatic prenyltransferase [Aspergillus affinis]